MPSIVPGFEYDIFISYAGLPWFYHFDTMLDSLRKRHDFNKVLQEVIENDELGKRLFSNALNKMRASDELKSILK